MFANMTSLQAKTFDGGVIEVPLRAGMVGQSWAHCAPLCLIVVRSLLGAVVGDTFSKIVDGMRKDDGEKMYRKRMMTLYEDEFWSYAKNDIEENGQLSNYAGRDFRNKKRAATRNEYFDENGTYDLSFLHWMVQSQMDGAFESKKVARNRVLGTLQDGFTVVLLMRTEPGDDHYVVLHPHAGKFILINVMRFAACRPRKGRSSQLPAYTINDDPHAFAFDATDLEEYLQSACPPMHEYDVGVAMRPPVAATS